MYTIITDYSELQSLLYETFDTVLKDGHLHHTEIRLVQIISGNVTPGKINTNYNYSLDTNELIGSTSEVELVPNIIEFANETTQGKPDVNLPDDGIGYDLLFNHVNLSLDSDGKNLGTDTTKYIYRQA